MSRPQLRKIEVHGFRSFGTGKQSFELPTTVAVLWGGNSQGKTSLAESIEFLLTGQIARRELLASTKEEFSDSLRNAHISDTTPVTVSAEVICPDGKVRCLKRTLSDDYKKGSLGCTSTIEIDGQSCQENDIHSQLGIKLFPSPLSAPVLAQHTLGYIFSAGPNERAAYFRAVLDTQDLEDFRAAVAAIPAQIVAPSLKEIGLLQTVEAMPELGKAAAAIRKSKSQADVEKNLLASTTAFLTNLKITPQSQLAAQAAQIEQELQNRRAKSFPLDLFARSAFIAWDRNSTVLSQCAQTFLTERAKIDTETRRLVELFKAALSLPEASDEHDSADCPLCGTVDALTSARVQAIREQVKATDTYQTAEKAIKQALQALDASLSALSNTMDGSLPKFMREKPRIRRGKGFTLARIHALVNDEALVKNWVAPTRYMARVAASLSKSIATARAYISNMKDELDSWNDAPTLINVLDTLLARQSTYEHSNQVYGQAVQALATPLKMAVDQSIKTVGWEELVKLARDPASLWNALLQMAAYEQKIKNLEKAIKEIDIGNGKVADEKFTDMSAAVKQWWDYLRPEESSFFDAVQRRSNKTRRTIDIKVGLSVSDDRSNPKFRDAIAVFSQSQLHCLGLSMFLARAVQEKTGFIIMDDPVLTSDDDFRPNFASTVIEGLLNEGLQVIILTQDHSSWKDIGHRWAHRDVVQFQIVRNDPLLGTEIRNQNDGLATMIAKAQPFIKSHDLEQRKEGAIKTRLAIERFGKEILVKSRRKQGDSMASITNYDGQNFGDFSNSVYALLTQDPAHPGKLRAAHSYVTPGPHDDTPPSSGQLSTALGDLKKLKRDYLD